MKIIISENQLRSIINESRIERNVVRKVVRDLTDIIKRKEEGEFYLPEDISSEEEMNSYQFDDYEVEFTIEFKIIYDDNLDRFLLNGAYSTDDDVVEIILKVNPDNLKKQMYDIIGELNIIIAHELEHGLQQYYDEFNLNKKSPKISKKYYQQAHEIPAQIQGFKRLAKLKRLPFEEVVRTWFEENKPIHNMKSKDQEEVIQTILKVHKEKYDK